MELEFRRIQGPYGKSRRYMISIPRWYAERILKLGYQGVVFMAIDNIAIIVPSKGYEIDILKERVINNMLYLKDVEAILLGKTSLISRLNEVVSRLEKWLYDLKHIRITTPTRITEHEVRPSDEEEILEDMPSFLKDNPWLRILSKRGKVPTPEYI